MASERIDTRRSNGHKIIGGHHGFGFDFYGTKKRRADKARRDLQQGFVEASEVNIEHAPLPGMRYLWYHAGILDGKLMGCGAMAPANIPLMMEIMEVHEFVEELWVPEGIKVS